jgi:hypothetical protein
LVDGHFQPLGGPFLEVGSSVLDLFLVVTQAPGDIQGTRAYLEGLVAEGVLLYPIPPKP